MPRLTEDHFRLTLSEMAKQSSVELFKTVVGLVLLKGDTVIVCVNLTDETNVPPLEQILFKVTDAGAKDFLILKSLTSTASKAGTTAFDALLSLIFGKFVLGD
jgi:hypothetical protein